MAYTITSQKGKDIAKNMKTGDTYKASDGSTWTKQSDGSVSVNYKGTTYNNAYTSSSGGSSGGGSSSNKSSGGGTSGSNSNYSPYTQSNYTIGSDYGKQVAQALGIGQSWTATDGSVWKKENDGSVTVNYNGQTTTNAWTPSDYGTLGKQQMAANLPYSYVQNTLDSRLNKALNDPSLTQYAYDDTYLAMKNYITAKMQEEENAAMMEEYQRLLNELNQGRPEEYQSQYDPQIDALLNQILNRDDFSYDVMSDPLYQQYEEQYQRNGDRAMRETLAEAAAGAGGMNSYAITAAQQAYNNYNAQLNDVIPQLYQLAYDMYINDKESQVQNLGILQNMDATQYNRYRDTMNDFYNDKSFAYGAYQDAINQGNLNRDFNYNSMWDNINFNNNNYLANKEYDTTQSNKDRETAKEDVWKYISMGVVPSADLIAKAGMSETDVRLAVEAVKAEQAPKGTSSKGGDNPSNNPTGDPVESNYSIVLNACEDLASKGDLWGAAAYLKEALDEGFITQEEYNGLFNKYNPLYNAVVSPFFQNK